jgi:ABC-type sugar transport system permease subunit
MIKSETTATDEKPKNRLVYIVLGFVFMLPAVIACGMSQLLLSVGTLMTGMQKVSVGPSVFIGGANYARLLQLPAFWKASGFSLETLLVYLLAVALVPALLAWGASSLGLKLRLALRVLFTIPVALFFPVGLALVWRIALLSGSDFTGGPYPSLMSQPALAGNLLLFLDGLSIFGLGCGLGLAIFLPVFRGAQSGRRPWMALLATWAILMLAAAAAALQSFAFSHVITGGGPAGSTTGLVLYIYDVSFRFLQIGSGAAVSTMLLGLLMVLGLLAGVIVILSRLRVGLTSPSTAQPERGALRLAALVVGLLLGVGAIALELLPFFAISGMAGQAGGSGSLGKVLPSGVLLNTILPPFISVVMLQIPIAYVAALGIGGLRPLGRHSEWLLLPFCPWLFVGLEPLGVQGFQTLRQLGSLGTVNGLVPPLAISIPGLVILTLFFKGRQGDWREAQAAGASVVGSFFRKLLLPSLPLAALLACIGLFAAALDPFWPMLVVNKPELYPVSLALIMAANTGFSPSASLAVAVLSVMVPIFLVAWIVFAVFQVFYLERVTVEAGAES